MNNKQELLEAMKEELQMRGYSFDDYAKAWNMLLGSVKVEGNSGKFQVIKVETENNRKMFPLLLQSSQSNRVDKGSTLHEQYSELGGFEGDLEGLLSNENIYLFAYGESLIVQVSIRFMSFDGDSTGFVFDDDVAKSGNRTGDFTAMAWDYNSYKYMIDPKSYGSSDNIHKTGLPQYQFCDDSRHSPMRQFGVEVLTDVFNGHPVIESILNTLEPTFYGVKPHNPRNPWDVLIEELDKYNKKQQKQER